MPDSHGFSRSLLLLLLPSTPTTTSRIHTTPRKHITNNGGLLKPPGSCLVSCQKEINKQRVPPASASLIPTNNRSSSSLSAIILPFDPKSFTTDNYQSPWLNQPPSAQPPAIAPHPQQQDFVLFPTPAPRQNPPVWTPPATTSSSTVLRNQNLSYNSVAPDTRRHSYQHLPSQPQQQQQIPQDPRVASVIAQSQGYHHPSSSHRFSLPGTSLSRHPRGYAASDPSYSPRSFRPPVPLFSDAESTAPNSNTQAQQKSYRPVMSTTMNGQQGLLTRPVRVSNFDANSRTDFDALFDLTTNSFVGGLDDSLAMYDMQQYDKSAPFTSANTGTVSPKDLQMDTTAPPSSSFTDLSTPSFESSAYFSHDTSPLFADSDLSAGHEDWESLFPSEPVSLVKAEAPQPAPPAPASAPVPSVVPSASPMVASASSPGLSPRTGRGARHSSVAGVKPRNREKPLPAISYDTSDPVAVKRARNTEAARKSRARKVEMQDSLERRIADLEKQLEETRQREQYWKSVAEAKS